jgi:flavin reductase (DIM6/NTAB) family NADH-FMN oxidoreductase RutF
MQAPSDRGFRESLGRFATGVTVVTAPRPGGFHGMTASAFAAASLDPPLVLVAISRQARMRRVLDAAGLFGVNVLAATQEGLARHFAGAPQAGLVPRHSWQHGVPLLEGVLARLACRVEASHPAGDHVVYLGRVVSLGWVSAGPPLLAYRGELRGQPEPARSGAA